MSDLIMERELKQLKRKHVEAEERQDIRDRLLAWKKDGILHDLELKEIQSDCSHSQMVQVGVQYHTLFSFMAPFECLDCLYRCNKEIEIL